MANPYPAQFTDDNNRLRLDGSVTFTAPGNQPGGGSSPSTGVTLTSAQLLSLHTTPVTLVPAPAASSYIVPARVFYTYRFGTTPYTSVNPASITFEGGSVNLMGLFLDILQGTEDQANYENEGQGAIFTLASALGKALVITAQVASPTAGNGTLEVTTEYVTITP